MNKVLIIEDDITKITRLKDYFRDDNIKLEESYQGGVFELKRNWQEYDFLVLDMTIPLWEKGKNDLGGNYEQFGGEKILREMKRKNLFLSTILFTMFDVFPTNDGALTFDELNKKYQDTFGEFYRGGVLFKTNEDNWIEKLDILIKEIKG